MFCKNCGNPMADSDAVCVRCGCTVGSGDDFCPHCAERIEPGTTVCPGCGYSLLAPSLPLGKSRITAGILGLLLGGLGIHNFYLGRTGKGVTQLLITLISLGTLSAISVIWGITEGIMILSGSIDTDANGCPLV